MDNSEDIGQRDHKLAPIFALKTRKLSEIANEVKAKKRKRKKSPKHQKPSKKSDINCTENDIFDKSDRRRSQRLKDKEVYNEMAFDYNEDTNDEVVCQRNEDIIDNIEDKLNDSVILIGEESNTIDYWTESKSGLISKIEESDDDIEIIPSDTPMTSSQESVTNSQTADPKDSLLWTEKYKPTISSEIIGHKVAVSRLKAWLEDWGRRESNKDNKYSGDDSEECLDESNSCLLVCGPTGSGKTSMIYTIAEELKYEVFELNASIKRNGRMISKILGEATQSHQMQKNNDLNSSTPPIHAFFRSMSFQSNSVDNDIKVEKVVKSKKKSNPKGIMSYFAKQNSVKNSSNSSQTKSTNTETEPKIDKQNESVVKFSDNSSNGESQSVVFPKVLSIASKSLILFDDIDVLIDDDSNGFWSAFNKIIETTKKPVIMTATQSVPYIKKCVNQLQVLTLNTPKSSETIDALKSICDKEMDEKDLNTSDTVCHFLSKTFDNDIRRCINELQFGTDWHHINKTDETNESSEDLNNKSFNSYYNSILFADIMQSSFKISTDFENRNNWMDCKPIQIENSSQSIDLAKDILETFNDLNDKIHKTNVRKCSQIEKPLDIQSIESISRFLSPNTSLRTVLLDYCPHLSFICQSESIRQSQLANHSRRSRRFMHHLDSIGIYIDNSVKTKLISAFASKTIENHSFEVSESDSIVDQKDDYFYE